MDISVDVCEEAVFSALPIPAPDEGGAGLVRGTSGEWAGARVSRISDESVDAWEAELRRPERHDEWQPERFGNERTERLDARHVYMSADVGVAFGAVHVRRQSVAEVQQMRVDGRFRSCWRLVDPAPFAKQLTHIDTGAPWQGDMYGGWEVVPLADGRTLVVYEWWSRSVPRVFQRWAINQTMPALIKAFDEHISRG